MSQLTHINAAGEAHMVDVSGKAETVREARAEAFVEMRPETLSMIVSGSHHKGDVFATARIAGIQAAKRTWELIPLCHPLLLSKVEVQLFADEARSRVRIESLCRLTGKTGVEMEALTLTLEHYPGMTEKALAEIVTEARERWPLQRVSVIHRVGELWPGDEIVFVGVTGAHRSQAFDAAQFIMDYLKTRAPFWKREATLEGDRWVEARDSDQAAAKRW